MDNRLIWVNFEMICQMVFEYYNMKMEIIIKDILVWQECWGRRIQIRFVKRYRLRIIQKGLEN
ncbi:unnamed protein product [Paramecium octaurelia]|uniref:Uncharacterized protein n=1 Tax=Paramecium octaurelia TaxID=43137 RepID=A0A8S1V4U3_PAROT|nr:unnamed protein product [Paramecium octaurelia]